MGELKKLFRVKRILAMVLAVTLAVTSAPATAQAAPSDNPEQTETNVEDTSINEKEEGTEGETVSVNEDADAKTQETTPADADAGTPEASETVPVEDQIQKDDAQAQQPAADGESDTGADVQAGEDSQGSDIQADTQEVRQAEITFRDLEDLDNGTIAVDFNEGAQSAVVTTAYSDESDNPFRSIVDSLKTGSYVSFDGLDGAGDEYDAEVLRNRLEYTWQQKGDDGNYSDMGSALAPVNAGEYRLKVSIDQELVAAESKYIDFIIEKAKLYITVDSSKLSAQSEGFAGKTVGKVQEIYAGVLQIALGSEDGAADDRYLQFVTAADKSAVTVSDPLGEALPDTEILKKGSDYLVEIAPALKAEYEANYELYSYAEPIVITELVGVSLKVESDLEPGQDITYLYGEEVKSPIDAAAAADRKVTVKITVDGVKDEATGEDKELPAVLDGEKKNITGAWLDANKGEIGETLPKNADAGVYYYKLTYTDPDGVYGVSPDAEDCLVKVVVEPVKLAVRPVLANDRKLYQKGAAASEALKNVSYELYEKDETGVYTKKFSIPGEKNTFWGVSYNQPGKPQYYEPVFKVQKQITTTTTYTDTTKTPTTVEGGWTDVTILDEASGETKVEAQSDGNQTVTRKAAYRVVFAGQKGLYRNGTATETVDINKQIDVNSANKNYDVDVTKAVVEDAQNVVEITVNKSTEVTINTEDIVKNINGIADTGKVTLKDGVYTKEYDEKAYFNDRSKYKKAKTNEPAADKAGSFTYEWYGFYMTDKLDDKGEVVKDDAGNPVQEPVCDEDSPIGTANDYDLKMLANAGEYCLKISYTDPTRAYTAKPAYLFFQIEGKLVKVVPKSEQNPKAYTGGSIGDFINGIAEKEAVDYSVFEKDETGTDLTGMLKELDQKVNAANANAHLYRINWVVLQGDDLDPAKAKYSPADNWDTFKEGVPYKLGARLTFNRNSIENKYYYNYTNECERAETDPIQDNYWYTTLDIDLGVMSDIGLKIDFHPEKLAALEEEYSGEEHFKAEDLIAAGYITVAAENNPDTLLPVGDGEGQVNLVLEWREYTWNEYDEDFVYLKTLDEGGNPVNADKYKLTVSYPGDDKYHVSFAETPEDFWIHPKDLTVRVNAELDGEKITAGLDMSKEKVSASLVGESGLTVTGYIDADKEAFADKDGTGLVKDAPAFRDSYNVLVWEKGKRDNDAWNSAYRGYLRYGREYEAGVNAWLDENEAVLKDKKAGNYNILYEDAEFEAGKRGNSTVKDVEGDYHSDDVQDSSDWAAMHVRASAKEDKVTVTPVSGICYFYKNILGIADEKFVPGNYLIFDIVAPTEFDANGRVSLNGDDEWEENTGDYSEAFRNFVYKNSIEETGKGYVLSEDSYEGTIRVAFPVTKEDQKTARTFTILWERLNGVNYTEAYTVDMSGAPLEDDLRTAVAPKTLAFNGVKTKMAVGETQQLDVKMTKTLNSDVVFLNYEVAAGSEKYASVTRETGVVTALSKGRATINVYPVRRNIKGEVERLPFKTVKTTITVNDVTAPKINSVYAYDNRFELKYTQPADGYRREVYVLEGKNKKAKDFEDLIKKVQDNGNNRLDEAFVLGTYITTESPDAKTKVVTKTYKVIEPGKEYTVYVRNVSGVRTLDDGSLVVSSASGTVKSFKSTKVQMENIRLDYKTETERDKRTPEEEKLYPGSSIDEIDLSKGSVQLQAMGEFRMQPGTSDADADDYEWKALPLNRKDPVYETQKLTYYAVESTTSYTKDQIAKNKNLKDYKTLIGDRYYKPSSIAKIDKKGKLTLKGVGIVYIVAYDSVSRKITPTSGAHNVDSSLEVSRNSGHYALRITSPITKISAKSITLKTGSHVSVRPSLTFYNGKKKLAVSTYMDIPLIVKSADDGVVEVKDNYYIIAKEPNKTVSLDVCLKDNPAVKTTLTVKTKAMDPVKSLKAVDVIDESASLTFTHTANENQGWHLGDAYVTFKIDLKDKRNRLISSHMEEIPYDSDKSDAVKGVYFYEYYIDGLKRQSVYNVTVTPFYGEQTAKGASKKFTTTNIPAYGNTSVGKDGNGNLIEGGMDIYVESLEEELQDIGYLTSGNSYTLVAEADYEARIRKTDTLTWKSSNSKVASVKANAGSYSAVLKASSVGSAYIEVTSKITKKVIARYIVRVKSVSNGGKGAYGDTEPKDNVAWDPDYDQGIEVLTEKNPVRFATPMAEYDYRWVSFTAPADGSYTLSGSSASISGYYYKTDFPNEYDGGTKKTFAENSRVILDEGDTVYFKVTGRSKNATAVVTVGTAEKYGKLTASGSVSVAGLSQVTFTVPEDNYYTFYASESGKSAYCDVKENSSLNKWIYFASEAEGATDSASIGLKKDQTVTLTISSSGDYTISVKGRTYAGFDNDGKAGTGSLADDGKAGSVKEKWFAFEAKAAGEYTFTVTPDKADAMGAKCFADMNRSGNDYSGESFDVDATDGKTLSLTKSLNEGDRIAIYVYATGAETVSADVSVSQPGTAEVSLTANTGELTVEQNKPVWVSFKVPETGREYCFDYAVETGKTVSKTYYQNKVTTSKYVSGDRFTSGRNDKVIYIKLETSDTTSKVTVSVKETAATAVTLGQDAPFEVKGGNMQFYTFAAPAAGLYRFETVLAEESKGKDVGVGRVSSVTQGAYPYSLDDGEKLLAGEKLILAVKTTESTVVKGNLRVTAIAVDALEAKEYTIPAGETKWFKFTPGAAGKYSISYSYTGEVPELYYGGTLDNIATTMPAVYQPDLGAGDVVYIKAVNRNTAESKITFTIAAAGVQSLPADGKLTVKAGSSVSCSYIVKQTGRYKVTYTADAADANPTVDYTVKRTSIASGEEIVCPTKGETIEFTVSAEKDAVVTLTMARIQPDTTLEATVAKDGGSQWFEYTAPATGRYAVAMTDKEGKAAAAGVTARYAWEITGNLQGNLEYLNDCWLNKGDKCCIRVENSAAADQAVKIAFTQITTSETLNIGAEPVTVPLEAGAVKWYRLNITEETYYHFTVENAEVILFRDEYEGEDSGQTYDFSSSQTEKMVKGSYLAKVCRPEGTAAADATKIGVKKENVLTLKEGEDLPISLENGGTQYVTFVPSKTTFYAFSLKDTDGVDSVNANIAVLTEYDYNDTITLSKNKVYGYTSYKALMAKPVNIDVSLTFTPAAESETTKTIRLCVEEIKPAALVSELSVTVDKGAKSWFAFTAPKAGYYNLAEDSKDVAVEYKKANCDGDSLELPWDGGSYGNAFPARVYVGENQKVVFCVFYDRLKPDSTADKVPDSATFKVTATPFETEEISLNQAQTITFAENETEKWYSVKPVSDTTYQWKFTGTEGTISVEIYRGDDSAASWYDISLTGEVVKRIYLDSNYDYLFRITSNDHPTLGMEISWTPPVDVSLAETIGVGETSDITIDSGYALFRFTAPGTGTYTFYTQGEDDTYGTLYNSSLVELTDDDDGAENLNFKISYDLSKGQTVYLKVRQYSSGSLQGSTLHVVEGEV